MNSKATITIIYALIVFAGGIIGYLTAGSVPSLIMGSAFGLLLLGSGWALVQRSTLGYFSATTLSAILALFFAYRFILTWKVMPAGMMAILSLVVVGMFLSSRPKTA